ncbi:MAG: hypothetical protein H6P98_1872, partial [Candidatus Aminicenantes bacterium]|nr:hypothetical protein [Candidatus Aminicenantes bacterium]
KVCDEFIIIKAGRILVQGALSGHPDLETLFFHYTTIGQARSLF